ncbi:response regulator [Candidatus Woesearchaeota archaeon]|nr:response regulator [Candidatus Woesearchaeota archaeon]
MALIQEKKKILIVDDEYVIRELVALSLGKDYELIKAENGEQALKQAQLKPDLIILDIMMPGMSGYDVCYRLKNDPVTKQIPIMMLTAKHEMEDLRQGIKVMVDEFLTKPFEPEQLKKIVDLWFQEPRQLRSKALHKYGSQLHYVRG